MERNDVQQLLTEVSEVMGADLAPIEDEDRSWTLTLEDLSVDVEVELDPEAGALRLVSEIGLVPDRADAVLAHEDLCRGLLRFNGDPSVGPFWAGLLLEGPTFVLTRFVALDQLTAAELTGQLTEFAEFYNAWFDVAEDLLAASDRPAGESPPPEMRV